MSNRDALRFIERSASDLALQSRLRDIEPRGDLDAVCLLGAAIGLDFTAAELRAAFLIDWRMRRRFYAAIKGPIAAGPPESE